MKTKIKKQIPSGSNHDEPHALDPSFNRSPIPLSNMFTERCVRSTVQIGVASLALCLTSCMLPFEDYGSNTRSHGGYQNGFRVNTLPSGYRREMLSGNTYYYHDGYYYRPSSNGYVVTEAPRSSRYYDEYERARQSRYTRSNSYGSRHDRHDRQTHERRESVSQLPSGYRMVEYRGNKYYKYADRYYVREDGRYYIVARPY